LDPVQSIIVERAAALGFNQFALHAALIAAGLDITHQAVNNWFRGVTGINIVHQPTVAVALGVSLERLVHAHTERRKRAAAT
jgi:hypothetical protein